MAETNRSLTILQVKDFLGDALKGNLKLFDKLSDQDDRFHKKMDGNLGKLNANWKMAGRVAAGAFVAAGAAAGVFFAGAIKKAEEFNSEFRELANLNLDKTPDELKKLENQVLSTATATGRLGKDINRAFFDVQSGTGKYGKEVEKIVEKASDFSRAFKVDFNTTIEGAVKGVRNFNLEADDMDAFFGSMVKTVQTGIVTFDQLAKVQTDYSGAAAKANQNIDSANKLFSIFTTKTKSAEEAATLTKSAFTDLLKPSTLEAFDKLGIKVFDKQTGKVKQLDEIVAQLNKRFAGARGNDRSLNALINEFKGSEGLVALIGEAAKNGDNMLEVFKQFDDTPFELGKALAMAKTDTAVMADIARNRLDTIMTRIGRQVLPIWVDLLGDVNENILPGIEERMPQIEAGFKRLTQAIKMTIDDISGAFSWVNRQYEKMQRFDAKYLKTPEYKEKLSDLGFDKDVIKAMTPEQRYDTYLAYPEKGKPMDIDKTERMIKSLEGNKNEKVQAFVADQKINLAFTKLEKRVENLDLGTKGGPSPSNDGNSDTDPPTGSSSSSGTTGGAELRAGLRGVQASEKVRNVNVRIEKLIGIETLSTTNIQESTANMEKMIREALIRSIRDAEVGISNSY